MTRAISWAAVSAQDQRVVLAQLGIEWQLLEESRKLDLEEQRYALAQRLK